MNRIFTIITILMFAFLGAQTKKKNFNNIIKSQDIAEITEFLEQAHPDDPRKPVLKKRLIQLKNEAWTKGKENHKPMAARPFQEEEKPLDIKSFTKDETEEFNRLMSENSGEHKNKTVGILNSLFDNDPTSKEVVVMIENKSDCNIIVRMEGTAGKNYKLPVPSKKQNVMIIEKGAYNFTSSICGGQYVSHKNIQKAFMITLGNPSVVKK